MVISTGITLPRWLSVAALYCLTKSMMLTPCGPSAVPTGGAGVAAPAFSCTLTIAAIFFFLGAISGSLPALSVFGVSQWFSCGSSVAVVQLRKFGRARSDLADLIEGKLHRGFPAEDRYEHLELLGIRVDLVDRRWQRRERPVHDGNRLADLKV